jgi:hypothetical protein
VIAPLRRVRADTRQPSLFAASVDACTSDVATPDVVGPPRNDPHRHTVPRAHDQRVADTARQTETVAGAAA